MRIPTARAVGIPAATLLLALLLGASEIPVRGDDPPAPQTLTAEELKKLVDGLGYESKVLSAEAGSEKWQFKVTQGGLDIPVAYEVTSSRNYVWFTVHLGTITDETLKVKAPALLRKNLDVQPSQFYVTEKNNLMLAIPLENRALNPGWVRRSIEKLVADVVGTASVWQ